MVLLRLLDSEAALWDLDVTGIASEGKCRARFRPGGHGPIKGAARAVSLIHCGLVASIIYKPPRCLDRWLQRLLRVRDADDSVSRFHDSKVIIAVPPATPDDAMKQALLSVVQIWLDRLQAMAVIVSRTDLSF